MEQFSIDSIHRRGVNRGKLESESARAGHEDRDVLAKIIPEQILFGIEGMNFLGGVASDTRCLTNGRGSNTKATNGLGEKRNPNAMTP